jgi:multimeric flavodoxin WrbA
MAVSTKVLGVVGSPNKLGRTQHVVTAALEGAAEQGASTEMLFLSDYPLSACEDCRPWTCRTTRRCQHDPEGHLAEVSEKFLAADAVVFGTPVYFGIASEAATIFMQRMHRTQANQANGVPALGIAVAGGTGGGLISGLRPVYHFLQVMSMRALRPLPVTRFNLEQSIVEARGLGGQLVEAARERTPFEGLERLGWYDDIEYLSMTRVEERVLLVGLLLSAIDTSTAPEAAEARRAYAKALKALDDDRRSEGLALVDHAYVEGIKAYDAMKGVFQ